ncbi:hypothetical protein HPB50_015899 [Hyalomma asiaticum]|uniref:Uncharacterized protein n=1 Tax=Hyalomma asiaticum TaxID=266040 RepID=A0ACB7SEZ0_HYAAI|nr:hypothetical protein HPB50_015899 [Hyalomma asiaticum]
MLLLLLRRRGLEPPLRNGSGGKPAPNVEREKQKRAVNATCKNPWKQRGLAQAKRNVNAGNQTLKQLGNAKPKQSVNAEQRIPKRRGDASRQRRQRDA